MYHPHFRLHRRAEGCGTREALPETTAALTILGLLVRHCLVLHPFPLTPRSSSRDNEAIMSQRMARLTLAAQSGYV